MRRMWWLLTLVVLAAAVAAYSTRDTLARWILGGGAVANAASISPPPANSADQAPNTSPGSSNSRGTSTRGSRPAGAAANVGAGGQPTVTVATVAAVSGALPQQRQTIGWIVA